MAIQIIHIVMGKANPNRMNGVNKVVNSLATYQTEIGNNVEVWGITHNPVVNYPERNYVTRLFQDSRLKFKISPRLKTAISELPKNALVHIHGAFIPQFYVIAKRLAKLKIPYVYTPHGGYNTVALERSSFKKKVYIRLFERSIVKNAKHLHFIGNSEIQGAAKIFGNVPHKLIPNGQNTEELAFDYRLIKPQNTVVFGFVGRLDKKTKGLDLLIEGFSRHAQNSQQPAELWIIGDGPDRAALEKLAVEMKVQDQVRFLGPIFGNEKLNTIANMDVFCLTSRNEGLPGVVLEALGLGVPCIVSQETNMGKYINRMQCGMTLAQNTAENIKHSMDAMASLTQTPHIENFKKGAKHLIETSFNWKNISREMTASYA